MNSTPPEVLAFVEQFGVPVFPCNAKKKPLTGHGFKDASRDPDVIDARAQQHRNCMWGAPTGRDTGLFVVDVDNKPDEGKYGDEALSKLVAKYGPLPDTAQVLTPSGGRHLYFAHPAGVETKSFSDLLGGEIGAGLDIRANGGYIIIPPSATNGHAYAWEASSDPADVGFAPAPAWLVDLALKDSPKAERPNAKASGPTALQRAIAGIRAGSPLHDSLRDGAAALAAHGHRFDDAVAILEATMAGSGAARDERYAERLAEIPKLVDTALRKYRGGSEALAEIKVGGAITMALAMPDLEHVIVPILAKGQKGTVTGHPGSGKTTYFVGLLVRFALRLSFGPLVPDADGLAYIVSAEDLQGTRNRILAETARLKLDWEDRNLLDDRLRWVHVESSATPTAIKEAIEADADGRDVAVIFVDTGPALFAGDDENDNVAQRNFVDGFGIMATLPGKPATVLAWHPSKGAGSDRLEPRGASAIKGSCDFNLTIWRDDDRVTLAYTKIRGEHFEPIEGRLSTVEMQAASGKRYFPPVVSIDEVDIATRNDAREAREAILKYLLGATAPTVRDVAKAIGLSISPTHRHLKHLSDVKPPLVAKDAIDDRYMLTKEGTARAKAVAGQGKLNV